MKNPAAQHTKRKSIQPNNDFQDSLSGDSNIIRWYHYSWRVASWWTQQVARAIFSGQKPNYSRKRCEVFLQTDMQRITDRQLIKQKRDVGTFLTFVLRADCSSVRMTTERIEKEIFHKWAKKLLFSADVTFCKSNRPRSYLESHNDRPSSFRKTAKSKFMERKK